MTTKELNKAILKICKKTEKYIKEQREGKNLEKPIMNDLVKTKKAMAYEDILEQLRKYANNKED
jgi:hypothetical protein